MTKTFIHTTYIRTADRRARARLQGVVKYAVRETQAVQYAEREGIELPEWHEGSGWPMEIQEARAWIDKRREWYTYARIFVLSPPPETQASLWIDEQRTEWVQEVMRAMGYSEDQYIYTWHEDPEHPHAHVIAFDSRRLTQRDLAAGREAGDRLAHAYMEEIKEDTDFTLFWALLSGEEGRDLGEESQG